MRVFLWCLFVFFLYGGIILMFNHLENKYGRKDD